MALFSNTPADGFLASFIDLLPSHKYTVIYTTTATTTSVHQAAVDSEEYEMDTVFSSPVHMDLKRDLASHKRESNSNITLPNGPLFEKYQYFSPGEFPAIASLVIDRLLTAPSTRRPLHGSSDILASPLYLVHWYLVALQSDCYIWGF